MIDVTDFTGSRLGRYDVIAVLGRGGMGVVYDAIDPSLGRHVALKVLPPDVSSDARRLARFVQEARAASALNHPNVVAIYEIGHEQVGSHDVHFIAMEKVEGSNLRTTLAGARLPIQRVTDLVAQIASAVGAAHSAGIVHRDLKPENIVLSAQGAPKVLDFGLAKLRPDDESGIFDSNTAVLPTDSGVILGTVGYMSPEQALGKPADHRSDIFSLGCILYEALAGHRAFQAGSSVETLNAIINTDPAPLRQSNPSASSELQRIVNKSMAKNPDERYQSAKEMAIDLRATLREEAERPQLRNLPTSQRVTLALLGLATVIFIGYAIASALRSRRATTSAAVSAPPALSVRRLTSRGTVTHVAISPDGRFLAYSLLDRSLRLRQLASGQELELIPPGPLSIWGLTFTPDGDGVVYAGKDERNPVGSCFRIPSIGGRPQHLFDGIDSAPAVSPDGRFIAWSRAESPQPGQSALMVANIDGSGARAVATRRLPERFAPIFFAGPSWSPDSASIASPVQRDAEPIGLRLMVINAKSGAERAMLDRNWALIGQSGWLSDGSGIVASAADEENDPSDLRLWLFPYPSGTPRRITAELDAYRAVSVARQGDLLASLTVDISAQVWAVPLAEKREPDKISAGTSDGWRGLSLLPDGRIVFSTIEEASQTLFVSNADGSGRTRLTHDAWNNRYPAAFREGIAYVSSTSEHTEVCVTDFEGNGRRVVVRDVDASPIAVSPDGAWLVFARNRRLWKMPMSGGAATQVVAEVSSAASWSPTGDRIALLLGDAETYMARAVSVVSAQDGRLLWSAPLRNVHTGTTIRWRPDGNALLVNSGPKDDRNLWLMPFQGTPSRLTDFKDQRAYFWDLSHDGKVAVLSRANITRDAVLISGFR